MKFVCTVSLVVFGSLISSVCAEPILARVLETSGSVRAGQVSGAIKPGATLPAGASIITGSTSRISLIPFPGSIVSFAEQTKGSVTHLDLSRKGNTVLREAALKLDEGLLFFAADQVNWDSTRLQILTPEGSATAARPEASSTASAGVVQIKKGDTHLAVNAGRIEWNCLNGSGITINRGSVLSSYGETLQVVDLTTGKVTIYDSKGGVKEERTSALAEIKVAAEVFAKGAAVTETLISSSGVNPKIAAAVSETILAVNQQLAALGIEPINTSQIGSLSYTSAGDILPTLHGAPGASGANPANISGGVRSPER